MRGCVFRSFCTPQTRCIFQAFCSPQTFCIFRARGRDKTSKERKSDGSGVMEGGFPNGHLQLNQYPYLQISNFQPIQHNPTKALREAHLSRKQWLWIKTLEFPKGIHLFPLLKQITNPVQPRKTLLGLASVAPVLGLNRRTHPVMQNQKNLVLSGKISSNLIC